MATIIKTNELKFGMLDSKGEQIFVTPIIHIVSADGSEIKPVKKTLALDVGYIVKAFVDNNPAKFKNVTKAEAGALLVDALQSYPADSTMRVYLPLEEDYIGSEDLNNYVLSVEVSTKDIQETAITLTVCNDAIQTALTKVKDAVSSLAFKTFVVNQPSYCDAKPATAGKRASGSKKVISLT
jgi:hypothetical protein